MQLFDDNAPVFRIVVSSVGDGDEYKVVGHYNGHTSATHSVRIGCQRLPEGDEVFDWGRDRFDDVVGKPLDELRRLWETASCQALKRAEPFLLKIENAARDLVSPFSWPWESLVGKTLASSDLPRTYYLLGLHASPACPIRVPKLGLSRRDIHQQPVGSATRTKVAIVSVPSGDCVNRAKEGLPNLLREIIRRYGGIEYYGEFEFDGTNANLIASQLKGNGVSLLVVIAHVEDRRQPQLLALGSGVIDYHELLGPLSAISSLQVAVLSWCWSDTETQRPAAWELLHAGVPAVVAWFQRTFDWTLAAFHRGLFVGLARGHELVEALATARSAIYLAAPAEDRFRAFSPRLYLNPDLFPS